MAKLLNLINLDCTCTVYLIIWVNEHQAFSQKSAREPVHMDIIQSRSCLAFLFSSVSVWLQQTAGTGSAGCRELPCDIIWFDSLNPLMTCLSTSFSAVLRFLQVARLFQNTRIHNKSVFYEGQFKKTFNTFRYKSTASMNASFKGYESYWRKHEKKLFCILM